MLPNILKYPLFDVLSTQTMRYVKSVPTRKAKGLARQVYEQVMDDFFINGSITAQSKVPEIMAGMWTGGREILLINDQLDAAMKEAFAATLSRINDCAYCEDMLISVVHAAGKHEIAQKLFRQAEGELKESKTREQFVWIETVAKGNFENLPRLPFEREELPEAIGCLFVFSYINRMSHVFMDGSPVFQPFGIRKIKEFFLRMFGFELQEMQAKIRVPGRALDLLPAAPLPTDMSWAESNSRISEALSRWAAVIDREAPKAIPQEVRTMVETSIGQWDGKPMPISRSWVDEETRKLEGENRAIARLALVVAKSSSQFDDGLIQDLLSHGVDEERLIRIMAWASFTAAKRFSACIAKSLELSKSSDYSNDNNKQRVVNAS